MVSLQGEELAITAGELLQKGRDVVEEVIALAQEGLIGNEDHDRKILAAREAVMGRPNSTEPRLSRASAGYLDDVTRATAHLVYAFRTGIYATDSHDLSFSGPYEIPVKVQPVKEKEKTIVKVPEDGIVDAEDHMHTGLYYLAEALVSRISVHNPS